LSSVLLDGYEIDQVEERPVDVSAGPSADFRGVIAILSPVAMTAIAWLVHRYLPNPRSSLPTTLYPLVLQCLLAASLVLAVVPFLWSGSRPWMRHHGPLFAGGVLILCLWDLITFKWAWLPRHYFPSPDMVLHGLVEDRAILIASTYHSLRLLLLGYLAGAAAGFATGLLIGWFRRVHYWGMPLLKVVGPIPATAFIPLAMLVFPHHFFAAASLIALAVWFPVTLLTASGIANCPVSYLDVAQTLGAGRRYLIFRVTIPAAMSHIFVGLFIGLAASFLTLIVAETVGAKEGLGWYLKWQQGWGVYAKVYGAILLMAVFFSTIMTLLFKARDLVLVWQKGLIRW
jgi:NitT/TauT family transport system permease protein